MEISTAFCAQLGCEHPIMQASMNHISGPELVSAVSRAGAFGVYALSVTPNKSGDAIAKEIQHVSEACQGKPFGVEFIDEHNRSMAVLQPEWIDAMGANRARVLIASTQISPALLERARKLNILVGGMVHTVAEAKQALHLDFLIARGAEAGGPTGQVFTSVLLPQVVDAAGKLPVVAAGGVFDGRGLASALCFGAQAVWVGTRFALTTESSASESYKQRLLQSTSDDTILTKAYTGPATPARVLRNEYTDKFEKKPSLVEATPELVAKRCEADGVWAALQRKPVKDETNQAIFAGQSAGPILARISAQEVVREMVQTAAATLKLVGSKYTKENGFVHTPLCDLFGVKTCVMSAGMGGIAGKDMTAIVSRTGGFGTFGSALNVANMAPEELQREIENIRDMCQGTPFGVDILVHGADGGVMIELIDAFAKGGAKAFVSGKGNPSARVVKLFHDRNMLVGSICGKLSHAKGAVKAGVDFVIVQGAEGGGHTGQVSLSTLLPQVVDEVGDKVPVIAAGGIYDGRGLASALCYGAQGVWVGTRFMMSPEAQTSDGYKAELLKYESEDTMVTKAYTGATMRVIRNPYVTKFADNPELLEPNSAMSARRSWNDGVWKLHSGAGVGDPKVYDINNQALVTGQNIGAIDTLVPCADIVEEMNSTCWKVLRELSTKVKPTRAKL